MSFFSRNFASQALVLVVLLVVSHLAYAETVTFGSLGITPPQGSGEPSPVSSSVVQMGPYRIVDVWFGNNMIQVKADTTPVSLLPGQSTSLFWFTFQGDPVGAQMAYSLLIDGVQFVSQGTVGRDQYGNISLLFDSVSQLVGDKLYTLVTTYNYTGLNMGDGRAIFSVSQIPEPGTVLLLGSGLLGVALRRRRKRRG